MMSVDRWTHFNPVKIVFQRGALGRLAELTDATGIAIVTSSGFVRRGVLSILERSFGSRLVAVVDDVEPNPDYHDVQAQAVTLRNAGVDTLIAVGGGSTIDSAKAIARLLSQNADAELYAMLRNPAELEPNPALPVVAVPSTAGTGAEVTPFGTVWDHEQGKKYSLVGDDLYPVLAVLDPDITLGLPEEVTISSGLDAISHALESSWNRNAGPVSLGLAARSLQLSLPSLPVVASDPGNVEARANMMQASTLAGLAISQSRTALAHSISYPITSRFGLPHGFACSFTLPALLEFNAVEDDGRLRELARTLGCEEPKQLADRLRSLFRKLGMNRYLSKYIPDPAGLAALSDQMFTPGRAENNLRSATEADVRAVLAGASDIFSD
jgi:alcohol dehydrogenase